MNHDLRGQSGAIAGRLGLLIVVVAGTALLLTSLFLPGAIALDRAVGNVRDTVLDVPPLHENLDSPPITSMVVARNGQKLADLHGEQHRVPVALSDIPEVVQDAVLATEDANFWQHNGINHRAIIRAAVRNVRSGAIEQGASTITQQYVRNVPDIGLQADTIERKIKEAVWAVELEKRLSKQEIFERYLNTVYFGNGVYGVGTAARFYFSKDVADLNLPEAALLAGLIRSPENNNPLRDPDAARQRRNIVISQMEREGFVRPDDAEAARSAEGLGLDISDDDTVVQPYFVEWVKQVLANPAVDVQPAAQAALGGETREEKFNRLFTGGFVIHTTLDPSMQRAADDVIATYLDDPIHDPLGAIVSVKPDDGAVLAMAVGPKKFGDCPEEDPENCEFAKYNPAVPGSGGSGREAGSAFKPIVHTAALEEGFSPGYSAETTSGQAIDGCGGEDEAYEVNNYAGSGGGYMDMYEATKKSNNVYHAKLARDVGIQNVVDMAKRLGITHSPNLNDPRYFGSRSCSIGLGTASVFPLDMAAAFATLANRGDHCSPFIVTKIEDRQGNLIYQHTPECEQVIDAGIADRVTDLMQGPPSSGGTAGYLRGQLGRPVAGKTGTTQDWTNAWFVGYVPQFSTAAWVGYEDPKCAPGQTVGCGSMFNVTANGVTYDRVTGGSIPGRMWGDYMERILEGVDVADFQTPPPIPSTRVPDVVGHEVERARATIDDRDLKSTVEMVTDHRPSGTVIAQTPTGGSEAWVGSVVRLEVSNGEGERPLAIVPDVVGMSEDAAVAQIEQAGLVARTVYVSADDDDEVGQVVSQSPSGGEEVEPGTRVVIAVGRDRGPPDDDDNGNGNGNGNGPPGRDDGGSGGSASADSGD